MGQLPSNLVPIAGVGLIFGSMGGIFIIILFFITLGDRAWKDKSSEKQNQGTPTSQHATHPPQHRNSTPSKRSASFHDNVAPHVAAPLPKRTPPAPPRLATFAENVVGDNRNLHQASTTTQARNIPPRRPPPSPPAVKHLVPQNRAQQVPASNATSPLPYVTSSPYNFHPPGAPPGPNVQPPQHPPNLPYFQPVQAHELPQFPPPTTYATQPVRNVPRHDAGNAINRPPALPGVKNNHSGVPVMAQLPLMHPAALTPGVPKPTAPVEHYFHPFTPNALPTPPSMQPIVMQGPYPGEIMPHPPSLSKHTSRALRHIQESLGNERYAQFLRRRKARRRSVSSSSSSSSVSPSSSEHNGLAESDP